jgi:chaperonin GroES
MGWASTTPIDRDVDLGLERWRQPSRALSVSLAAMRDGTVLWVSAVPGGAKLPIKMLNDRVLVKIPTEEGERRSSGGILIPATAQVAKRLVWAEVVRAGANVRTIEIGDQVLFSPEDRYEVEVRGDDYLILRERDIHAVAASRLDVGSTGLYL